MSQEASREGWAPVIGRDASLEDVIDEAFDYRGDVTLVLQDGRTLVGYVYNRDRYATPPFLLVFDPAGASHTIRYADVRSIAFTGKDMAAGKSYEAWRKRRAGATAT
jgi:hypothetical protein